MDTHAGAGVRNILSLPGAAEIPVFFPLALVYSSAGAQGVTAQAADCDTAKNTLADCIVSLVDLCTAPKIIPGSIKNQLGNQRLVGVFRDTPLL